MKHFEWDEAKNKRLRAEREISFEDIATAIKEGHLVKTTDHPNKDRYPNQRMFIVEIDNYIYLVPFVEDDEKVFLKTIIPSRKATKEYLEGRRKK